MTTQEEPSKLCLSFFTFDLPGCTVIIVIVAIVNHQPFCLVPQAFFFFYVFTFSQVEALFPPAEVTAEPFVSLAFLVDVKI